MSLVFTQKIICCDNFREMADFDLNWEKASGSFKKYSFSTYFERVYLEIVQEKNSNSDYSWFWDVIRQDTLDVYKFDENFENEVIENTTSDTLDDIWDFVSLTAGFQSYAANSRMDTEFGDCEFEMVYSHYSQRTRGPPYTMSHVFEEVFSHIVPRQNEHRDSEKGKKDSETNPKKKKKTSQNLKTLLELRMKRLKLIDDNIQSIRIGDDSSPIYECKHCGFRSKRKRKLFVSHVLPLHITKPKDKSEKKKRRKNKLKVLVRSEVEKRYICSNLYCTKKFTSSYARKRHSLSVHKKTMQTKMILGISVRTAVQDLCLKIPCRCIETLNTKTTSLNAAFAVNIL